MNSTQVSQHPIFGNPLFQTARRDGVIVSIFHVTSPEIMGAIRNWEHNRPPDPVRVVEIGDFMRECGVVDGEILVAHRREDGGFVCYDGAHRLAAVREEFPVSGVLVRVVGPLGDGEIAAEFRRINKTIPVPELYFSEDVVSMRATQIAMGLSRGFAEMWRDFVSTARRPRRPNFSRDALVEEIGAWLMRDFTAEAILGIDIGVFAVYFVEVNRDMGGVFGDATVRRGRRITEKIWAKCCAGGFYLTLDLADACDRVGAKLNRAGSAGNSQRNGCHESPSVP